MERALFELILAISIVAIAIILETLLILGLTNRYRYLIRPALLLSKGEHDKSLQAFNKALNKRWIGGRSIRNMARYNIANIHHRLGQFEESNKWLDAMELQKPSRIPQALYYGLYAHNLIMMGKDLDVAEDYLNRYESLATLPVFRGPSSYLLWAYLYLLKGDVDKATAMVSNYRNNARDNGRRFYIGLNYALFKADMLTAVIDNYFLGLYYRTINNIPKAKEHLTSVASSQYDTVYRIKASQQLEAL